MRPDSIAMMRACDHCTRIVSPDRIDTWEEAIAQVVETPRTAIKADVERNRRLSLEALNETLSVARWAG